MAKKKTAVKVGRDIKQIMDHCKRLELSIKELSKKIECLPHDPFIGVEPKPPRAKK